MHGGQRPLCNVSLFPLTHVLDLVLRLTFLSVAGEL